MKEPFGILVIAAAVVVIFAVLAGLAWLLHRDLENWFDARFDERRK